MPALRVILLWHQHQPFYKDLVTGEYRLPWTRLHALKDYYGMVKLLDEFPNVHQNFNLVPSLMVQIQDYVDGTAQDPFLRVAAKPAKDLTLEERRFALQYLFQANPQNLIGRYPRYRELWERFREHGDHPERAERYFQAQDFTDLQVLSQIAWFDEFFLEEKDVAALVAKGHSYSLDDQKFVIARERELLGRVLPAHAEAAKKGSIELSATPFYHPILPLVCDTSAGAVSSPGLPLPQNRFRHPEDAREQLTRGLDLHEKVFGVRPKGVWPSEGSVSEEVLAIAHSVGVQWMATDEGVLGRSTDCSSRATATGGLPGHLAEKLYNIHRYENGSTAMHLVFRDHTISDLIGFVYSGMPPADAARHLIGNIKEAAKPVLAKGRDAVVSIILDGENAWEYYPKSGREFLRRFYDGLQREPGVEAVTVSEAIARHKDFGKMTSLVPGLVDQRELQCVDRRSGRQPRLGLPVPRARVLCAECGARDRGAAQAGVRGDPDCRGQRLELVVRAGTSLGQRSRFRRTLPQASFQCVSGAGSGSAGLSGAAHHRGGGAPVVCAADGVHSSASGGRQGALFRVDGRGRLYRRSPRGRDARQTVFAGFGVCRHRFDAVYGRLDFAGKVPEEDFDLVVNLESWASGEPRPRRTLRVEASVHERKLKDWKIENGSEER